jgi:uncharacterized membrane protein YoaK (UPF0700 family)
MDSTSRIRSISLVLTFVAGFCDTVTFVAADELFSAHVTGNFIVLAYDLVSHTDTQAWLKLLTFPVFIMAVMTGRWIVKQLPTTYILIQIEGVLLVSCGALSFVQTTDSWLQNFISMLIVFALGLQNAFGRLYSQQTYGPTTVMTGTVTQAALDVADLVPPSQIDSGKQESLKKQSIMIVGFLTGCLLGALTAKLAGLGVVFFPGALLLILFPKLAK